MSDINFQPVFDYIDSNNKILREDIMTEVRMEMSDVKTALANLSSQVLNYHQEI